MGTKMVGTAMTRRGFFIGDKLYETLRLKAISSETPISEHVRAALAAYLNFDASKDVVVEETAEAV